MRRFCFALLSALSMMMCIAAVAVWAGSCRRSRGVESGWNVYTNVHRMHARASDGMVSFEVEEGYRPAQGGFHSPPGKRFSTDSWGMEYRSWVGRFGYRHSYPQYALQVAVFFPIWWMVVLLLVPPAAWAGSWWQKRDRREPGHCAVCGYDLRATPGRCPECGNSVKQVEGTV